ncbi:MAG: hypothetical protein KVP17_001987 [Porospora cf. gigantea B]|uniref:uncharacterized protein n=2 Tax=Porospora cf. gigantea B TaxID=2853592 RepID=UPI0035718EE5|nr:MAG: hypothetical protein KVP17_001987 [Porospora cf. gigantea B]
MRTRCASGTLRAHLACLTLPLSGCSKALVSAPRPRTYAKRSFGKPLRGVTPKLKDSIVGIADLGQLAPPYYCVGCSGCNRCRAGLSQEIVPNNKPNQHRSLLDKMQNIRLACRLHDPDACHPLLPMRFQSQHKCACFHTCARDDHRCGRQRYGFPLAMVSEVREAVSAFPWWCYVGILGNICMWLWPLTPFRSAMLIASYISVFLSFMLRHIKRKIVIIKDPTNIGKIDEWYTTNGIHIGLLCWFIVIIAPLVCALVVWMEKNIL